MRIFQHTIHSRVLALAAAELAALLASPWIAAALFPGQAGWRVERLSLWRGAIYAAITMVALVAVGLYHRRQRARVVGIMVRIVAAVFASMAAFGFLSFMLPAASIPRSNLVPSGLIAIVLLGLIRVVSERFVDEDQFRRRVIVLGTGVRAASISQLRRRSDQRGFLIQGFVSLDQERSLVPADRLLDVAGTIHDYCARHEIDEIVVAMDDRRRNFPVHELLDCRLAGIEVTELLDFFERETGKVRLDVLNPAWMIFAPGFRRSPWRTLATRVFDIAASLVILFFTWPVMLLTVLLITIEDGWRAPVLYRQERVGLLGVPFRVLKFRSMRVDAEQAGPQWAVRSDPRVTRVGAVIRKVRIDELPQLFNVLRGNMSFVGPRPERPEFVAALEERVPYYRERHSVKPGLTGWAQLCYPYGASEQDAAEKLQYDLYYIKNRSLLFDLMILLQTVEIVLLGKGGR